MLLIYLSFRNIISCTYIIIGLGRDKKALYASFQYLILGTMGATFIVIAIGLLYVTTGTLNLFDLSFRVKNIVDNPALITAYWFFVCWYIIKSRNISSTYLVTKCLLLFSKCYDNFLICYCY